jgi:Phospholipase B
MRFCFSVLLLGFVVGGLPAAESANFQPDPHSVQRYGPAYRYPQAGWIVLHIEGDAYERGVQHGRLLAPEIAAHLRCYAAVQNPKSPTDGWQHTRTLVNALFLRRYEEEYLKEMKGIADGASAAGARFDSRPIDLIDIVALNAWPEIDTLDSALHATPTGLEAVRFPLEAPTPKPSDKPMRCSAFAATGPATKDGKIVFGHITMFSLYPSSFYNVWLDVKPAKGYRVLMQTYPGGIQSGLDYYLNEKGILVCETTLAQTRFDITGTALASRIRQALQYADSIDKVVEILKQGNNGLYTNEWLLADTKTNEIAMFELGTHKTRLWRSSKNEWFGGTEGFYWGCNNTKDLEVRLETVASREGQPAHAVFKPSDRDRKWLQLYDKYKGKMDVDFGKLAFTTPPLAAFHSVDAKFTTTALAQDLKTWALFGPPLGRTWQPTFEERKQFPEIQPLVGNPWAVLHAQPPTGSKVVKPTAVDLHDPGNGEREVTHRTLLHEKSHDHLARRPAWRGTLLPAEDADVWLATAFADYERIASLENALKVQAADGKLTKADREQIALALFAHRADYELAARSRPEKPLKDTQADLRSDEWYRVAANKGVLMLAEMRSLLGAEAFDRMMDEFGGEHAGKAVTTRQFVTHLNKHAGTLSSGDGKGSGSKLDDMLAAWLEKTGLPGGAKGGPFSVLTFHHEPEQTLIVYGTEDETPTNREAAEALQQAIRARHSNLTVPIKSDREATDEELKTNHVLLIGRPETNRITKRFAGAVPVKFGHGSFTVQEDVYAHARSAVLAAGENPLDRRFSMVVVAGLDASSTLRAAPLLLDHSRRAAEVVVLPSGASARSLVLSK